MSEHRSISDFELRDRILKIMRTTSLPCGVDSVYLHMNLPLHPSEIQRIYEQLKVLEEKGMVYCNKKTRPLLWELTTKKRKMNEPKESGTYWRLYLEKNEYVSRINKAKVAIKVVSEGHDVVEFRALGDVMWLNDWQKISENQEEE